MECGGDGRQGEEGGGVERGRLVLVRCLVSVETDGVEKTNYLFLAKRLEQDVGAAQML